MRASDRHATLGDDGHWYGWVTEDPEPANPYSPIYVDGMYNPDDSPSMPYGYVHPKIAVQAGRNSVGKDPARRSRRKAWTKRKGHQYDRVINRMEQARINDSETYTHPIIRGARYKIIAVPAPSENDLYMPNRRIINGNILQTYQRVDRDWVPDVTPRHNNMTEAEIDHVILSNFRTARVRGNIILSKNDKHFLYLLRLLKFRHHYVTEFYQVKI